MKIYLKNFLINYLTKLNMGIGVKIIIIEIFLIQKSWIKCYLAEKINFYNQIKQG